MPGVKGRVNRPPGLGSRDSTVAFIAEDYLWLQETAAARMCSMSVVVSEAVALYRETLEREMERVEREERAARRAESRSLDEDVEP